MDNENTYITRYGAINISTVPSSEPVTLNVESIKKTDTISAKLNPDGTLKPLSVKGIAPTSNVMLDSTGTYSAMVDASGSLVPSSVSGHVPTNGISLGSGNTVGVPSSVAYASNTVEVDNDPANTYGLATKIFLKYSIDAHNTSTAAHSGLFNGIITQISDLYEKHGELHAYKISDNVGNVINASGKVILRGDTTNPKYLMYSSVKNKDFDKTISDVLTSIDMKQTRLTPTTTDLTLDLSGNIGVVNMRYDDTAIADRVSELEYLTEDMATTSYVDSQIGQVLTEAF